PRPVRMAVSSATTEVARRTGKGLGRAQLLSDAAAGRVPFWGGAIAYQDVLKERLLANGQPVANSHEFIQRLWREAERERPNADLLQKMTYVEVKQRLAELLLM